MVEFKGQWWIPGKKKQKFIGTLSCGDGKVVLIGQKFKTLIKTQKSLSQQQPIILGEMISGKKITLVDCQYIRETSNWGGGTEWTIRASKAIIGKHFAKKKAIGFSEYNLYYDLLDSWTNIHGFKRYKPRKKSKVVSNFGYKFPKLQKIQLDPSTSLQITFSLSDSGASTPMTEVHLKQHTFFNVKSSKLLGLDTLFELRSALKSMLVFSMQSSCNVTKFQAVETSNGIPCTIEIFDDLVKSEIDRMDKIPNRFNALLVMPNLGKKYRKHIKNWINLHKITKFALPSYSAWFNSKDTYLEYHFLGLIHSLEGLLRVYYPQHYMNQKLYQKVVVPALNSAIPAKLSNPHKSSLKSRIKWGYEVSLRKRIQGIYGLYRSCMGGSLTSMNKDISDMVDTRNYLVHQDQSLKANAVSGQALFRITMQVKRLIEYLILRKMGFGDKEIKGLLKNFYQV